MTFKYSTGPMRPIFIPTLESEYIRVDDIEKFWVTGYPDPSPEAEYVVVATMRDWCGGASHDLFVSNDRKISLDWLDSLVRNLNSVAE